MHAGAAFLACLCAAAPCTATPRQETGATFVKVTAGARPAGMGEAFVGLANDLSAIRYNPAGLVHVNDRMLAHLMHAGWLHRTEVDVLSLNYPWSQDFVLAGEADFVHGDVTGRDFSGRPTRDFTFNEATYTLAAGGRLRLRRSRELRLGAAVKVFSDRLAIRQRSMGSLDLGAQGDLPAEWNWGTCLQNLGPRVSVFRARHPQPLLLRLGVGKEVEVGEWHWKTAALATELDWQPVDRRVGLRFGAEAALAIWDITGFVRGGWRLLDTARLNWPAGPTFGLGLHFPILESFIQVDYALVPYGDLGPTHRFSLTVLLVKSVGRDETAYVPPVPTPPAFPTATPAKGGTQRRAGRPLRRRLSPPAEVAVYPVEGTTTIRWSPADAPDLAYNVYVQTPDAPEWKRVNARPVMETEVVLEGSRFPAGSQVVVTSFQTDFPDAESPRSAPRRVPAPPPPGFSVERQKDGQVLFRLPAGVLFDTGRSSLRPEAAELLALVLSVFGTFPGAELLVQGHTDDQPIVGGLAHLFPTNQALSEARAFAVKEALAGAGIARARMRAQGHGESRPVSSNDDEEGRSRNRRVDLILIPAAAPADGD